MRSLSPCQMGKMRETEKVILYSRPGGYAKSRQTIFFLSNKFLFPRAQHVSPFPLRHHVVPDSPSHIQCLGNAIELPIAFPLIVFRENFSCEKLCGSGRRNSSKYSLLAHGSRWQRTRKKSKAVSMIGAQTQTCS